MKKRYELQYDDFVAFADREEKTLQDKIRAAKELNLIVGKIDFMSSYRVVQKLGRKVIKVIYPKGK